MNYLRRIIPDRNPLRLFYHKIVAFFAAVFYRFPAKDMIVIGVTGTNGKTTVVNMITSVLNEAGYKTGMASTINFQIGKREWVNASKQTTLGPFYLQKLLLKMKKEGCTHVVLEVTSHAIDQSRIFGIDFDVAVITGVTSDHVEYHGSFGNYLKAKGELFRKVSESKRKKGVPKTIILNADDKHYEFFDKFDAEKKISYGMKDAEIRGSNVDQRAEGSSFTLHVPDDSIDVKIKVPGKFNIYNSMAAAGACLVLGVPLKEIAKGLEAKDGISGRFERVDCGQKFNVIVDYAHGPDSLESLLSLYKDITSGRVFVVFGATGGGRDKGKRPVMGEVAHKYADYIIVTDDDPYEEDELDIIEQVSKGIPRKEGECFWKIPDRKEAIKIALTEAEEGDTVVIAGKGAEEIMMLKGERIPWNDRKVVEELLGG